MASDKQKSEIESSYRQYTEMCSDSSHPDYDPHEAIETLKAAYSHMEYEFQGKTHHIFWVGWSASSQQVRIGIDSGGKRTFWDIKDFADATKKHPEKFTWKGKKPAQESYRRGYDGVQNSAQMNDVKPEP